jgi:hypothetical protein
MGDYAIKALLEVDSTPEGVKRWLDSPEGIAGWWSDSVDGDAGHVGGTIQVRFPTTSVPFDLVVSELADDVVEWNVPESPPWWKGTTIRFEVNEEEEGTTVRFTHSGFDPEGPHHRGDHARLGPFPRQPVTGGCIGSPLARRGQLSRGTVGRSKHRKAGFLGCSILNKFEVMAFEPGRSITN